MLQGVASLHLVRPADREARGGGTGDARRSRPRWSRRREAGCGRRRPRGRRACTSAGSSGRDGRPTGGCRRPCRRGARHDEDREDDHDQAHEQGLAAGACLRRRKTAREPHLRTGSSVVTWEEELGHRSASNEPRAGVWISARAALNVAQSTWPAPRQSCRCLPIASTAGGSTAAHTWDLAGSTLRHDPFLPARNGHIGGRPRPAPGAPDAEPAPSPASAGSCSDGGLAVTVLSISPWLRGCPRRAARP